MSKYTVNSYLVDDGIQVKTEAGKHTIICDEGLSDGGKDSGPDPVEYLAAAVDSCISISVGEINKTRHLNIKKFHIENHVMFKKTGPSTAIVSEMNLKVSFDSSMSKEEKEKFMKQTALVSTVFQTVSRAVKINLTVE